MAWEKKANIRGPIGGAFPDAPSDGTIYARKDEGWVPAVDSFPEAPVDGEAYARKDGAWSTVDVDADTVGQLPVARVPDAQPLATVLTNTTASFTTASKAKLDGVATGATANSTDAALLARGNHTGTQLAATISDFAAAADARISAAIGVTVQAFSAVLAATTAAFTTAKDTKLSGIATGATANSPDATLLARANHTGTQAISTISGLDAALAGKQPIMPVREVLTANRTYYVRTDGSDANTGLTNTSGGAFLTIQNAIDVIYTLDLGGFEANIQVADGTYTGTVRVTKPVIGGLLRIVGNAASPGNVVISHSGYAQFHIAAATVYLGGFEITNMGSGAGQCILVNTGAIVTFVQSVRFGASDRAHIECRSGGVLTASGQTITVTGNAPRHLWVVEGGQYVTNLVTTAISGSRAFSVAFVNFETVGVVFYSTPTFTGTATGKKHLGSYNAVLQVSGGGGLTALPGNVAGTVSTGAAAA